MPRVKGAKHALKKRREVLKKAKGYRLGRSKKEREAREAIKHAGNYAYRDRRKKKSEFRKLWQIKISAALNEKTSYSKFIDDLKKKEIGIDRKILADLAENNPEIFNKIVEKTEK